MLEFRAAVSEARAAARAGRTTNARDRFRAALALWRGPALAGIDRPAVRRAAAGLEEERTQALVECIDQELALGGGAMLTGELTDLVHQHPYWEKLHAALMLALYRAGRQADALAAYQQVRRTLVSELGQEPGPELRELHQRILTSDDSLRVIRSARSGDGALQPLTAQCLPRTIDDFTGRAVELAWLLDAAGRESPHTSPVLVVDGMPGVGKTSLAVRAAHLLKPSYPDGQLFIDLHGHSEHQPPVQPAAALGTLLGQLDLPAIRIPIDLEDRIARWRAELATRRLLVVLDNAASASQVTPLLPASTGCLTLVTSRRRLIDLDGGHPVSVDTLDPGAAVTLLERIAGPRVRAEPAAANEVAKRCGYLPLALRLAGARLAHRPSWRVRDLANRLATPDAPFTELTAGDSTLADVFRISYAHLTPGSQRALRLFGIHPGPDLDLHSAAALTDTSLADTRRVIDELVDAHLVEEPRHGRFRLHDLVKAYASRLAASTDPGPDRDTAIGRLLDYYVHATVFASTGLESRLSAEFLRRDLLLGEPERTDLHTNLRVLETEWLENERASLIAAIRSAPAHGHHQLAWQLARALWRFLSRRGHLDDLIDTHRTGLAAAEQLGDLDAAATMRNYLAFASARSGRQGEAIAYLEAALAQRRATGDRIGEAAVRRNLFLVYAEAGRVRDAARECQRALATARMDGDPVGLAHVVGNAGYAYLLMGRYADALRHSRRGLLLARETGD